MCLYQAPRPPPPPPQNAVASSHGNLPQAAEVVMGLVKHEGPFAYLLSVSPLIVAHAYAWHVRYAYGRHSMYGIAHAICPKHKASNGTPFPLLLLAGHPCVHERAGCKNVQLLPLCQAVLSPAFMCP